MKITNRKSYLILIIIILVSVSSIVSYALLFSNESISNDLNNTESTDERTNLEYSDTQRFVPDSSDIVVYADSESEIYGELQDILKNRTRIANIDSNISEISIYSKNSSPREYTESLSIIIETKSEESLSFLQDKSRVNVSAEDNVLNQRELYYQKYKSNFHILSFQPENIEDSIRLYEERDTNLTIQEDIFIDIEDISQEIDIPSEINMSSNFSNLTFDNTVKITGVSYEIEGSLTEVGIRLSNRESTESIAESINVLVGIIGLYSAQNQSISINVFQDVSVETQENRVVIKYFGSYRDILYLIEGLQEDRFDI